MKAKRVKPRRTVHPVQPAHRLGDGSVKRAEYRVGVDLRRLASGEICCVRHADCRVSRDYTVLAHLRIGGTAGMSQKPSDILALPVCDIAHDMIDGRAKIRDVNFWKEVLCGYLRWLNHLLEEGHLRT